MLDRASVFSVHRLLPALALLAAHAAQAQVLYEQAALEPPLISWTSHQGPQGGGQVLDSFSLQQGATAGSVTWRGAYWGAAFTTSPTPTNTESWVLAFYTGANEPGTLLARFDLSPAQVASSLHRVWTQPSDQVQMSFYDFQATLPMPLALEAGTRYWFSVLSKTSAGFEPLFIWTQGSGGDGSSTQVGLNAAGQWSTGMFTRQTDRAFSVSAVPEPGTWALMAAGALAVSAAARRRVRRAGLQP